jgi:AraC-like DNA-binding protein
MEKSIERINWFLELENMQVEKVDNDFLILDKSIPQFIPTYPFKSDVVTAIICTKGSIKVNINLKEQIFKAPGLAVVLSDQIIQFNNTSEDFAGLCIIMSKSFAGSLDIEKDFSLYMSILYNSFIPLSDNELEMLKAFYMIVQRAVTKKNNPYRLETLKCLIKAFYYSWGYDFHKAFTDKVQSKQEQFMETFLLLVSSNYKNHKALDFYADKLCLTSKHLSKVIKESSGKTASEWIESYVILEAKALLKSTNFTIQQVSDELNFPSQSFFGKYFRRLTGMSPSEYKAK